MSKLLRDLSKACGKNQLSQNTGEVNLEPCDVQVTNATGEHYSKAKKEAHILGHTPQTLADMDVGEKPPGMDLVAHSLTQVQRHRPRPGIPV